MRAAAVSARLQRERARPNRDPREEKVTLRIGSQLFGQCRTEIRGASELVIAPGDDAQRAFEDASIVGLPPLIQVDG